jgi:hypothetical protein
LFQYPTVEKLSRYIEGHLFGTDRSAPDDSDKAAHLDLRKMKKEIEGLSLDELAERLKSELDCDSKRSVK